MDDAIKLSVVIPVYNEAGTIAEVIRRVLACGFETEVIVVDDASTDNTAAYLKSVEHPRVHCFYHAVNRGKGAALRTGFAAARHPYVIVQDADLEYDPRDYRACSAAARRPRGHGLWLAVSWRTASRAVFLALRRQPALTLVSNICAIST